MPIIQAAFTLSDTVRTKIVAADTQPQDVNIHNATKSSNEYVYIGNSSVGTANSFHLDPGQTIRMTLGPGDDLWAVSKPSGLEVQVLVMRHD